MASIESHTTEEIVFGANWQTISLDGSDYIAIGEVRGNGVLVRCNTDSTALGIVIQEGKATFGKFPCDIQVKCVSDNYGSNSLVDVIKGSL